MNNDQVISFMSAYRTYGGTEYMVNNVMNNILPNLPKFNNYNCIVLPGVVPYNEILLNGKKNIIWLHNLINQYNLDVLNTTLNKEILDETAFIICVSKTHKQQVMKSINFPSNKIIVIPNAIDKLKYKKEKFQNVKKVKLFNTSDPSRGLGILIQAMNYIDKDIELEIFNAYDPIFEDNPEIKKSCEDKRITFYGKTPKKTVIKHIENSHIHAYPGLYLETFCLSQAEAMSAGCLCVYGNLKDSAIEEISGGFGFKNEIPEIVDENFVINYAKSLNNAIEIIENKEFNPEKQINYINNNYSWEIAKNNWTNLHNELL